MALAAGCSALALASAAFADPPGRVGTVGDVEGEVSMQLAGSDDWVAAELNYPVTSGESFWTGEGGRLELPLGGQVVRLDYETALSVIDLRYGATRLGLTQGSIDLHVWQAPEGGIDIATPAGDVLIGEPGIYRVDVGAPDDLGAYPPVEVTTIEGDAQAPGANGLVDVPTHSAALVYAGYDPEPVDAQGAPIDQWGRQREYALGRAEHPWLPSDEPGAAMLDAYGQWAATPDYGEVWVPSNVPADWAPYRYGRWTYVEPWGWTWIDHEPWGFAPFHYGRWVDLDGRWGWAPGAPTERPVYAPALVAFLSVGGGGFAWAPLAPNEPYIPPYQVSQAYVRAVNTPSVSVTVVNSITVNNYVVQPAQLRNARAATAVSAETMTRGAPVHEVARSVGPEALAAARAAPAAPPPPPPARAAGAGEAAHAPPPGARPAAPPPLRVRQIQAAVATEAPRSAKPPPIAGVHPMAARPAPPPPHTAAPVAPAARKAAGLPPAAAAAPEARSMEPRAPAPPTRPPALPPRSEAGPPAAAPSAPELRRAPPAETPRAGPSASSGRRPAPVEAAPVKPPTPAEAKQAEEKKKAEEKRKAEEKTAPQP